MSSGDLSQHCLSDMNASMFWHPYEAKPVVVLQTPLNHFHKLYAKVWVECDVYGDQWLFA